MKQQWSISKDKLVHLEEGLPQNEEYQGAKAAVRSNNCKRAIQLIKLILYIELLLFIGWFCYSIWQTDRIRSMEVKVMDTIGEQESQSLLNQKPIHEISTIAPEHAAEIDQILTAMQNILKEKNLHSEEPSNNNQAKSLSYIVVDDTQNDPDSDTKIDDESATIVVTDNSKQSEVLQNDNGDATANTSDPVNQEITLQGKVEIDSDIPDMIENAKMMTLFLPYLIPDSLSNVIVPVTRLKISRSGIDTPEVHDVTTEEPQQTEENEESPVENDESPLLTAQDPLRNSEDRENLEGESWKIENPQASVDASGIHDVTAEESEQPEEDEEISVEKEELPIPESDLRDIKVPEGWKWEDWVPKDPQSSIDISEIHDVTVEESEQPEENEESPVENDESPLLTAQDPLRNSEDRENLEGESWKIENPQASVDASEIHDVTAEESEQPEEDEEISAEKEELPIPESDLRDIKVPEGWKWEDWVPEDPQASTDSSEWYDDAVKESHQLEGIEETSVESDESSLPTFKDGLHDKELADAWAESFWKFESPLASIDTSEMHDDTAEESLQSEENKGTPAVIEEFPHSIVQSSARNPGVQDSSERESWEFENTRTSADASEMQDTISEKSQQTEESQESLIENYALWSLVFQHALRNREQLEKEIQNSEFPQVSADKSEMRDITAEELQHSKEIEQASVESDKFQDSIPQDVVRNPEIQESAEREPWKLENPQTSIDASEMQDTISEKSQQTEESQESLIENYALWSLVFQHALRDREQLEKEIQNSELPQVSADKSEMRDVTAEELQHSKEIEQAPVESDKFQDSIPQDVVKNPEIQESSEREPWKFENPQTSTDASEMQGTISEESQQIEESQEAPVNNHALWSLVFQNSLKNTELPESTEGETNSELKIDEEDSPALVHSEEETLEEASIPPKSVEVHEDGILNNESNIQKNLPEPVNETKQAETLVESEKQTQHSIEEAKSNSEEGQISVENHKPETEEVDASAALDGDYMDDVYEPRKISAGYFSGSSDYLYDYGLPDDDIYDRLSRRLWAQRYPAGYFGRWRGTYNMRYSRNDDDFGRRFPII